MTLLLPIRRALWKSAFRTWTRSPSHYGRRLRLSSESALNVPGNWLVYYIPFRIQMTNAHYADLECPRIRVLTLAKLMFFSEIVERDFRHNAEMLRRELPRLTLPHSSTRTRFFCKHYDTKSASSIIHKNSLLFSISCYPMPSQGGEMVQ